MVPAVGRRAAGDGGADVRASGYDRAAADWYQEPPWAIDALLAAERPFNGLVWDPCCGGGNIPRRLIAAKVDATASDIANRGYGLTGIDFFALSDDRPAEVASIVSNPPYDSAQAFVDHALTLTTDRVCVLLRLAFLEGQKRRAWFQTVPLARVHVSSRRMSMPPGGTDVPAKGGTVAFAWFCFEHGFVGRPQIGWV